MYTHVSTCKNDKIKLKINKLWVAVKCNGLKNSKTLFIYLTQGLLYSPGWPWTHGIIDLVTQLTWL
jgi:hypothetical protein